MQILSSSLFRRQIRIFFFKFRMTILILIYILVKCLATYFFVNISDIGIRTTVWYW